MHHPKIEVASILGMSRANDELTKMLNRKRAQKRNWRVLSLRRELQHHKIKHYFLSLNQIVVEPIPFLRSSFTVSIHKIPIPGASFTVDYYAAKSTDTGHEFCSPCATGQAFVRKLIQFCYLSESELNTVPRETRYEPYQYCPVCGDRNKLSATVCEMCNAKLK